MTAPTDLCQLSDVKAWLNIATGDTTYDAMLGRLISACSMTMQAYMNRLVNQATYTDTFNGDGKTQRMVKNYPIQSVASVTVDGQPIPQGVAPSQFTAQQPGWFFDQDTVYLFGYSFCDGYGSSGTYGSGSGTQNCSIVYSGGLPASDPNLLALAQACIEQVSLRFKERSRIGERNKSVNGEVIGFMIGSFPADVVQLMDNLKNVVPLQ
jgi:hypothetical protein